MGDSYRFTSVYCGCRDAEFNWVSIIALVIYATVVTTAWVTGRFATKPFRCLSKYGFAAKSFRISLENIQKMAMFWKMYNFLSHDVFANLMAFERAVSSALPSMHDIKLIKSETSGFPWRGLCVKIANILYCLSMGSCSFLVLQMLWPALNDTIEKLNRYLTRLTNIPQHRLASISWCLREGRLNVPQSNCISGGL